MRRPPLRLDLALGLDSMPQPRLPVTLSDAEYRAAAIADLDPAAYAEARERAAAKEKR